MSKNDQETYLRIVGKVPSHMNILRGGQICAYIYSNKIKSEVMAVEGDPPPEAV